MRRRFKAALFFIILLLLARLVIAASRPQLNAGTEMMRHTKPKH